MKLFYLVLGFVIFSSFVYALPPVLDPLEPQYNLTEDKQFTLQVTATGGAPPLIFSHNNPVSYFNMDSSGNIDFVPDASVSDFVVVIIAMDTNFEIDTAVIQFLVNRNPTLTPIGQQVALNNTPFIYTVSATDLDTPIRGDVLTYLSFPDIGINPSTGDINLDIPTLNSMIPTNPNSITIMVNDSMNTSGFPADGMAQETFDLIINDPVFFDPIPANFTEEDILENTGVPFTHNISQYITNFIGDLTYTPNESFINIDNDGILTVAPNHTHIINSSGHEENTTYNIEIIATEIAPFSESATQIWQFKISRVNDIPICDPIDDKSLRIGENYFLNYSKNASDEEDLVNFFDNGSLFEINITTGIINFTVNDSMVTTGVIIHNINITVNDTEGTECSQVFMLTLIGNKPPIFPKNKSIDLYPLKDLYVDSSDPDNNFPNDELINISGGNSIKRGYLMFNLNPLGSPAALINAFLNLTIYNASGIFDVSIHDVSLLNFSNISYNNPGNISLEGVTITTKETKDEVDVFDLNSIIDEWFNNTNKDRFIVINVSDESAPNNISYYSIDSPDNIKWPVLSLNYLLNISDYNWTAGSFLISVFDLDDFFYDPDGDILDYDSNGALNILIFIDEENRVTFDAVEDFIGEETVTFIASDGIDSVSSNEVKLTVEKPPPFETQSPPPPEIRRSTRTRVTKKVASIGIIFDTQRRTVEEGERIEVPIKIKNTGEVGLSAIDLELLIDKTDLRGFLSLGHIDSLAVGGEEELKMTLDTKNAEKSRYTISLNAKARDIEESAVFILDILQENIGTFEQIEIAKRLFKDNPECLEFQEIVIRAEEQLRNRQLEQAQSNIESAIEGCKSIIREEERPGLIKRDYERLIVISLIIMAFTLFLVTLYLIYKRMSYRLKE